MRRSTLMALAVLTAGSFAVSSAQDPASKARRRGVVSGTIYSFKPMPDGNAWTTDNLKIDTGQGRLSLYRQPAGEKQRAF